MQKYKKVLRSVVIIAISLLLFVCIAVFYVASLKDTLQDELRNSLAQTAESTGWIIEENINSEIKTISSIASMLGNNPSTDSKVLVEDLMDTLEDTDFLRFGVADLEGNCYTTDHYSFDVSTRDYFQASLKGKSVFSKTFEDVVGKKNINVFSSPIYHDGVITNILFASVETERLSNKLLIQTYDGKGFSEVANADGTIIIRSDSKSKKQTISSISELEFLHGFEVSEMKNSKEGVAEFLTPGKEERYLAYYRLSFNDWYILSIVPNNVVGAKINHFLTMAIITWLILAVVFVAILCYIYLSRIKSDKKMNELIFYDELTKHYNYNRFRMKTQEILDRHEGIHYSLVDIDVKDFKMFNEFYGYQGGDFLLKSIMEACKAVCTKEEACSRISADRFILLLKTRNKKELIQRIKRIIQLVEEEITASFNMFNLNYKVGIYLIEESDTEFSKCHDRCTYAKKRIYNSSESLSFFSKEMYEVQLSEKKMESLMEEALTNKEFEVYLQPKVTLSDHRIHSAEALVRWNSPIYGLIPPDRFIPLFEQNGFLERLDMYMLQSVCQILETWKQKGYAPIVISVNLSRVYLFKPHFVKRLIGCVNQFHVDPGQIQFEITESVIFDRSEELKSIILQLKANGFSVAMDDFGSGYSSLNMLKDIPIDVMKLDQGFFRFASDNLDRSKKIIESVIMLAKGLQIHTVAEGVEKAGEVAFLETVGCDEVQGYYYSKPLPYPAFVSFYETFITEEKRM